MISFFGNLISAVMMPLEYAVAWIMVGWHTVLTAIGMNATSGWTWSLSIVGLVIVIRILLIPLFVRQIKASRALQLMQPHMKKVQEKYKGKSDAESREAMSREMFALYKEHKANPLSSCMPILLQSPIFFALFRVLNGIPKHQTVGPLNATLVAQADQAQIFGSRLSETFMNTSNASTKVLTVILIALMSLTTFTTQRQLMTKNMPATALEGQFAQQQKIMLYLFPLIFAFSGINFPIGVLLYWLTTNLWSMGQQFYVIRRMPAPGSAAEKAWLERQERKQAGRKGGQDKSTLSEGPGSGLAPGTTSEPPRPVRNQPKNQPRGKRTPPPRPPSGKPKPSGENPATES